MRVLITGGTGFIGAWITKNLLAEGHDVFIFDISDDAYRHRAIISDEDLAQVRFLIGDITRLEEFTRALEANEITHVIHLAGLQVPTCRANPILGAQVNVLGTLVVFEALKSLGSQIQRLVYASSSAVFGTPDDYSLESPLDDNVLLLPRTHYGVYKCCNEGNARIYYLDHGISSVGLRPWTVYGPGRDFGMTSEPTKAILAALRGEAFAISFGGWTDFQYVNDVAQTFILALQRPYEGAQSFNLRGTVTTLEEFRQTLVQIFPAAAPLVSIGTSQLMIAYNLSDDRLQRELGPMPRTSLAEGIQQTLNIFQSLIEMGEI